MTLRFPLLNVLGYTNQMVIHGHIENGVVIPHGDFALPNGTEVTIVLRDEIVEESRAMRPIAKGKRIQVPLVHCDRPGSVNLTGERIAEILDEEDGSRR